MKVETLSGDVIDLGTTETTPTIGITDYSRRVTDDFGVTTVVKRGFSRRMSVKFALPTDQVDAVQRLLANLRASVATWVADPRFASLRVHGFYKDFAIDLPGTSVSYCTLTVEGLAETEDFTDPGDDPAPAGLSSTLRVLPPTPITPDNLYSDVPETDAAEWSSVSVYSAGMRVMAAHRLYDSLVDGNAGNDPASTSQWIDIGPTNRWAMFDQALGTATTATGSIGVIVEPPEGARAVALLDVNAAQVKVQLHQAGAQLYERVVPGGGQHVFLDLPAAPGAVSLLVTITGADASMPVSVGTLLIGNQVPMGITEASPSAGITDYSRKATDDFGAVTVVERAWSKRMTAAALIRSDAVDTVVGRFAVVRARPCLWIGDDGQDALTIYGFYKDFTVEVGETTAKLSLTVEGLSKAAPIAPAAVPLVPRGDFNPATGYQSGDLVQYEGSSWLYIAAGQSAGNVPPSLPTESNAFWRVFARAGGDGSPGSPGTPGLPGLAGASAFTLANLYNCVAAATTITKNTGGDGWNGKARTVEGYPEAALTAVLPAGTMIGLTTDPDNSPSYETIDYAIHRSIDGNIYAFENGAATYLGPVTGNHRYGMRADGRSVQWLVDGAVRLSRQPNAGGEVLYGSFAIEAVGATIGGIAFTVAGHAGEDGATAPLVLTQWSIDGATNWHDHFFGADRYYRQSNDNGATWGPAILGVGESGTVGTDGNSPSVVFVRSATVPATPTDNTGNPPTGWYDGPPAGTAFLWLSKAIFRGATQLTSWSTPQRISGDDGAPGEPGIPGDPGPPGATADDLGLGVRTSGIAGVGLGSSGATVVAVSDPISLQAGRQLRLTLGCMNATKDGGSSVVTAKVIARLDYGGNSLQLFQGIVPIGADGTVSQDALSAAAANLVSNPATGSATLVITYARGGPAGNFGSFDLAYSLERV